MNDFADFTENSLCETKEKLDYFKNLQNVKKELYEKLLNLSIKDGDYWFIDLDNDTFTCTSAISSIFKSEILNDALEYYINTYTNDEKDIYKQKLQNIQKDFKDFTVNRNLVDANDNTLYIKETICYIPVKNMLVGVVQDLTKISEIKKKIASLDRIMQQFLKVFDKNIMIIQSDVNGKITYASSAFSNTMGYDKEFIMGKNLADFEFDKQENNYYNIFKRFKNNTLNHSEVFSLTWQGEIKYKKNNSENLWLNAFVSPIDNQDNDLIEFAIIGHDITINKKLQEYVNYDALTGIYNRRCYSEMIPNEINRAKRDEKKISFVMIDIDFFKQYNDIYGHRKGDEALKLVANTLKRSLKRGGDFIFRMGGEEFCVVFSDYDDKKSLAFCEKLRQSIEDLKIPHIGSKVSEYLTISAGLVVSDMKHEVIDELGLYTSSDNALYEAKKAGRNRVLLHQVDDIEFF